MGVYKDAVAYVDTLIAQGYQPDDIIGFANTLIEHAFTAHPSNVTPDVVTDKDRLNIIEQALTKLALMTGLNELSQHVEATYCEKGLVRKSNSIDVDEMYNAVKLDSDDTECTNVSECINDASYDMDDGDMGDERAMFVEYTPVYDEHYNNPSVMSLRETIAKQMANLRYPNGYFGTTY